MGKKVIIIAAFCLLQIQLSSAQTNTYSSSGDVILLSGNSLIYDHLYNIHGYTKYDYAGLPEAAMLNHGYYGHRFSTRQGIALVIRGDNNYIGVGTTDPKNSFHLNGGQFRFSNSDGVSMVYMNHGQSSGTTYSEIDALIGSGAGWGNLVMQSGGGNVGIGTTSPTEKLAVNGKIRAKEVKVEASPWPDFVFDRDYQLPDLKETERFVRMNRHLPGIPSAEDVEKQGINLGEMNASLLQKIEELTLHLIEKDKRMTVLEEQVKRLMKRQK